MSDQKPDWAMSKREVEDKARAEAGLAPRKRRGWLWALGIVLLLAAGGGWFVLSGQFGAMQIARAEATAQAEEEAAARAARAKVMQIAPYEVTRVEKALLREELKVTGTLTPARKVHLSAEVSARVIEVSARAGDRVRKGDVLVQFDVDALETQLRQARSNAKATEVQLALAQSEFDRTQNLVERGLAAPATLDRSRSSLDQLTAALAAQKTMVVSAERALANATVSAPFDGVVSERRVDAGGFVGAGSPLFTIVDLASLEVDATAPVAKAPLLSIGQKVEVRVEGFGERRFEGAIERISPVAIAGTRMLPVFVSISNEDGALRGGMFASGTITTEAREGAIGLPVGAVRNTGDGSHVIVIVDGKAERRDVELAREWFAGRVVEIASGLEPGDLVLTEPLPEVTPGTPVELTE